MLVLEQIQDIVFPYKTYGQSHFRDAFESFDGYEFFGGIASSFVDLTVWAFSYSLDESVSLD